MGRLGALTGLGEVVVEAEPSFVYSSQVTGIASHRERLCDSRSYHRAQFGVRER